MAAHAAQGQMHTQMSASACMQPPAGASADLGRSMQRTPRRSDITAMAVATRRAAVASAELLSDDAMRPSAHFPDEHLFAIYAPLLLPLVLPLFYGWLQEYRRYRIKRGTVDTFIGRAVRLDAKRTQKRDGGVRAMRLVDWRLAPTRAHPEGAPVLIFVGGI